MEICYHDLVEHQDYVSNLKQFMAKELENSIPGLCFNGNSLSKDSLYTVLNVTFPENQNADMLLFLLDLDGVACSGGSACSSGAAKGSHVLDAIDALKPNCASIRFSFSRMTTREEVEYAIAKVREHCKVPVMA